MKNKYWLLALGTLVAVCVGLSFLLIGGEAAIRAEICLDGELYQSVDLRVDQEFTVPCPGGYNTVTVRNGKIAVTDADCPDQYCMKRGFCDSGAQIVCLPHKLVITFLGESEVDGALG